MISKATKTIHKILKLQSYFLHTTLVFDDFNEGVHLEQKHSSELRERGRTTKLSPL